MIEIYLKSNTNYDKNGDITLNPISCKYKDSEKLLTLEHFQDEEGRWKYINYENIIAVEKNNKKIFYRIYNVVRSLYNVTAYARPLFYDLIDKVLLDVRPTNKLGQEALNIILEGTGFIGHSNLTTLSTAYYIRKNIVEALIGDTDNSFIKRWGGEFYSENFDVYINDRIGSDNGVRVEFGYNLNEIEEDINIEDIVTRIVPIGFNEIMLEGNSPWIDSPLINKYTKPKMRVIEFGDVKVKENPDDKEGFNTIQEARAELVRRCNKLYEGGIDKPLVNYKIDMINLANTTAYEDFKILVNVKKGDTVTCYIPHLEIDVKARVIDFEEDEITGEYILLELGNATNDFFKDQADIKNRVDIIFNSKGNIKAETLEGAINALQTQFKALRDVAQPQTVRAILFEDRIEDSPTFGCMCLGTMGFEIASSFKPGTQDWDFRTFGTGKGFVADHIITGILNANLIRAGSIRNKYGSIEINLDSNAGVEFRKNGEKAIDIVGSQIQFYDWEGTTRRTPVGAIYSARSDRDASKPGMVIGNEADAYVAIGYFDKATGKYFQYINFDKDNVLQNGGHIIDVFHSTYFSDVVTFNKNVKVDNGATLSFESNDNRFPHLIFNSQGLLNIFGDNGLNLGYRNGETNSIVMRISENVNNGSRITVFDNLDMNGNSIKFVSDIFNSSGSKYYHNGWCGSIESTAKRISNLNIFYDSGWYAYSDGANGAPSSYGIMLHFKWNTEDFIQIAFDFANTMYQRSWVNGAWTAWKQR